MFRPSRQRDAYAAIRGYVYQIDRTIGLWLDLRPEESLELERGEDIDLVSRLAEARGTPEESRLLEQVKHRASAVTLSSAAESMANFHDHRTTNACGNLRFRFLTNAAVGRERLNPFPNRTPGILLWEDIRSGRLPASEESVAISLVRRFLSLAPRPQGLDGGVWSRWQAFLTGADDTAFRDYIARFEWSTGQPDASQTPIRIRSRLLELGHAQETEGATVLADRLFVRVARLLGTRGIKRLTPEGLKEALVAPPAAGLDRDFAVRLRALIGEHADRLDRIESDLSTLGTLIGAMIPSELSLGRPELDEPVPDLSVPFPVSRLSRREETVGEMLKGMEAAGWLAIHGGPDFGKSQLAIRVTETGGRNTWWVRFRTDMAPLNACRVLDAAEAAMSVQACPGQPEGTSGPAGVADGFATLIVLDDLPRFLGGDPLSDRLAAFGHSVRGTGGRILSTSQHELPSRLRHALGQWLDDRPAPPFTDNEARGLLLAHGAPDGWPTVERVRFLNGQACGHPLLLAATAEFFAARGWAYRQGDVMALLRGDHRAAILPDVVGRLTQTLDRWSRELLYRLSLTLGTFDLSEVSMLARVGPPVEQPLERFNGLLGAWVQRDGATRFGVSPLATPFGRSELESGTMKGCYRALADATMRQGVIGLADGERAIAYHVAAEDFGKAVTLYVLFLVKILDADRADHFVRFIDKWRTHALPTDRSVGERLFVRSYQLAAFTRYGLDTRFMLADIDALLSSAGEADGWGVVSLAAQNLGEFRRREPRRALRYVRHAVGIRKVVGPDGRELELGRLQLTDMLWMSVVDLRTPEELEEWVDAVAGLDEPRRSAFWTSEVGQRSVEFVADGAYLREWEKPAAERQWIGLADALARVLDRARPLNRPRLEAALTGTRLEILGDQKRLDDLPGAAATTLERWPADPDVQFRTLGTLGRQYAYNHHPATALPLLETALGQQHAPNDRERLRCLIAASFCVDLTDLRYAELARDLARQSPDVSWIEACRALGEYAISYFQARGDKRGAIESFETWSEALERFLGVEDRDMFWRDLFPLYAYTTWFLANSAQDGYKPELDMAGNPAVEPKRGFLLTDYLPAREALYRESGVASIALLMSVYATAAHASPSRWISLAVEESRRSGAWFVLAAAGSDATATLLADGRFEDALELGVFSGRALVVHDAMGSATRDNCEGTGIDVQEAFRQLPPDRRMMGERFALIAGAIPAAVAVARLALTDPEAARTASDRVAAICRQLAADDQGDAEMWRTAAGFFEADSSEGGFARTTIANVRAVAGDDDRALAMRAVGYVLACRSATPQEAAVCHLSVVESLLRWYRVGGEVCRLLVFPLIGSYWRQVVSSQRFMLRSPHATVAAVEAAGEVADANQMMRILTAVALDFRLRGAHEVLQRIRGLQA